MEVGFIERELPIPLHIVVDERNGVSFATKENFKDCADDLAMKQFTFHLANIQRQFDRIWIIVGERNSRAVNVFF
ncbi:hypothetical protein PINS_up014176 [Pythium insidiosum]|nr:hypothetical protein PINS_up014176 [Pythium insidiosum]